MKTIALLFAGLMLLAQEPAKKPATIEELQSQVTQLQQQIAQKDQQIAAMQASITASQKMFGACFQNLADAEQRAAAKK
jgi:peptidoglycan hydrolase CwlO-like protein